MEIQAGKGNMEMSKQGIMELGLFYISDPKERGINTAYLYD